MNPRIGELPRLYRLIPWIHGTPRALHRSPAGGRGCRRPGVSGAAGASGRAVRAGRAGGHRRPHHGTEAHRGARPAVRGGQPRRRRGQHRPRGRRPLRARWLYSPGRGQRHQRDQPQPLPQDARRSGKGPGAGQHGGFQRDDPGRASFTAGKQREAIDCARALEAGRDYFRIIGQWLHRSLVGRAVQEHGEGGSPARAIQGRGAGADGPRRGTGADDDHRHFFHAALRQGGPAEGARGFERKTPAIAIDRGWGCRGRCCHGGPSCPIQLAGRGLAAGRRLVAACERAGKILPKEVAAELARPYPRAP